MSLITAAARAGVKRPRNPLHRACCRSVLTTSSGNVHGGSLWYRSLRWFCSELSMNISNNYSMQQQQHLSLSNHRHHNHRHLSNEASSQTNNSKEVTTRQNNSRRHHPNNRTSIKRHHPKGARSKKNKKSSSLHQQLLSRLQFFFSDINLRHDAYSRSLLIDNKYLPIHVIMSFNSIKRISDNVNDVLDAIIAQQHDTLLSSEEQTLESKTINGELVIGRTAPFHYEESMEQSLNKIMVVSGWPVEINTRLVEDRLKALLSDGASATSASVTTNATDVNGRKNTANHSTTSKRPIVYWGKNVPNGIITIEFDTESSADAAWETLHSMTQSHELLSGEDVPVHSSELICEFDSKERRRRCTLMMGDLSLVMERMGVDDDDEEVVDDDVEIQLSTDKLEDETTNVITDQTKLETEITEVEHHVEDQTQESITASSQNTSSSKQSTITNKWWDNKSYAPSLYQCIKTMEELYAHHRTLPPPPRDWLHESKFNNRYSSHREQNVNNNSNQLTDRQYKLRQELCADVASIVGCVHNSINGGVIRALGARDAYAMSDFLNRAMLILSESPPKKSRSGKRTGSQDVRETASMGNDTNENNVSPYEACLDALNILQSLNLDVHPHHYSYAVRSACHELRWEEAARIFLGQVDGVDSIMDGGGANMHDATGGFAPLDSTLGWDQPLEVGLYAVAIDALNKMQSNADGVVVGGDTIESSPSSQVFRTAMKMSMIAPSRQENYILAAGCALGRAGLWSDCLDFATDPNNISMYGPSIPAAAMLSCIESQRSEEAIELYDYFFNSDQNTASEWQWSGGNLSAAKPPTTPQLTSTMSLITAAARAGVKRPRNPLHRACCRSVLTTSSGNVHGGSLWYRSLRWFCSELSMNISNNYSMQQQQHLSLSNHRHHNHRHLSNEASSQTNNSKEVTTRQNNSRRHHPNNRTSIKRHHPKGARSKKNKKSSSLHQQLQSRLQFFFSDINLRHDAYSRSLLIDNKYLPIHVIMSFNSLKRISDNVNDVLDAIIAQHTSSSSSCDEKLLPLETKTINGELVIGRTAPFHYEESMEQSLNKIMVVSGWPVEINTKWAEDRLKALLSDGASATNASATTNATDVNGRKDTANHSTTSKRPIVYWGKNVPNGIITIEFDTESSADAAWETLHSMTQSHELSREDVPVHSSELICEFDSKERRRRCTLMVGDLSLVMERMGVDDDDVDDDVEIQLSTDKSKDDITNVITDHTKLETESTKAEHHVEDQTQESLLTASSQITSSSKQSTITNKWWDNKSYAPSLYQCIKTMEELYAHHRTLPPPPRDWLHESRFNNRYSHREQNVNSSSNQLTDEQYKLRQELCADVASIVGCVHNSIDGGVIRALGARDAYAMSDFLNRAMLILSESPPKKSRSGKRTSSQDVHETASMGNGTNENNVSPYEACLDALNILQSLNLDVHPHHYSYAVRSACHELRWEEAARIFLGQVDGVDSIMDGSGGAMHDATGGFAPLDSTLGWDQPLEVGLYAVAIDALNKVQSNSDGVVGGDTIESSPSSQVFRTAMKMSMIAPSRQENYILAAGCALGRAGLWSDCLDFATDPNNISMYGPSIPAAAMLSCIESQRSEEAIELYDYFFNSDQNTASEWQWSGGNLSAAKPLFDNLLLRAMGGSLSGGFSAAAIKAFCDMVDSDIPISVDAIVGLMHSIEHDGDWQSAIHLFKAFLFDSYYHVKESKWRLVNERPNLSGIDDVNALTQDEVEDLTAELLASTMRACNNEGFYSLSILLSSITHSLADNDFCREMLFPNDASAIEAIESQKFLSSKSVRDAYIHSLSKVGLQRIGSAIVGDMEGVNTHGRLNYFPSSGEAMLNAFMESNQVLVALEDVRQSKQPLSKEDKILISRGLASAMNFYLDAHHPASAMQLFRHASEILTMKHNTSSDNNAASFTATISTLFEDDRSDPTAAAMFQSNDIFDYEKVPVGSLRFLRSQAEMESDMNTRRVKAGEQASSKRTQFSKENS